MKLSTKIILPIILISVLLILLNGCISTVPTDESPEVTEVGTGKITGIIAAPCCYTSDEPVSETSGSPEYWCYYCEKDWNLQDGVKVILTSGQVEIDTTTTNDKGEYTFTDVPPGENFVITAYCPGKEIPLVMDVVPELGKSKPFDAKTTDLVSTSLGLVVDYVTYFAAWDPEDISLDKVIAAKPDFPGFPKFRKLIREVRRVLENCEDVDADVELLLTLCKAAEEVSESDMGCAPGFTPEPEVETTGGGGGEYTPPVTYTFTLTAAADPPAGGTVTGGGTYDEGTVVTVQATATPNTGWYFANWTGDLTGDTNPASITMNSNKNVIAHFFVEGEPDTYFVTFAAGSNGSLTGTTSYTNILHGTAWSTAITTVPTPVPAAGYQFTGWTPSFPATVTASATYTASFAIDASQWHTVTFAAGSNGSLSGTLVFSNILNGTAWGTAVTVPTPNADPGYQFDAWTPSFPATVTASATYTASFAIDASQWHTVTFAAGSNGSLSGTLVFSNILNGTAWGTAVTVPTPNADPGYQFDAWTPSFPATVTASATYTASFAIDASQWHTVTFAAGSNGSLSGTLVFSNILNGTAWSTAITTVPTPVPAAGYQFTGWTPSFPATVTASATYTASFAIDASQWHTVTFAAGSNGSLSGTLVFSNILNGTAWGTAVTVPTPNADPGYQFDAWTPSFPATVTASATYTASFAIDASQWHTVTFAAGSNGSLSGTLVFSNILNGTAWGTAVTVPTPNADPGYQFDAWTPSFPATVTASATYTANFAAATGCLTAKVYNPLGAGYGAGWVKLFNNSGDSFGPFNTVADGWYTFYDIPVGTYTLIADGTAPSNGPNAWIRPSTTVIIVTGTVCQEVSLYYTKD